MRFAVLSDIHGNLEALRAVLADASDQQCRDYVCLGDLVGYNANPAECLKLVRDLNCPTVKGNHDEQASITSSSIDFNQWAEQAILWTRAQLREEECAWLRDLPLQTRVRDFTIVHATLHQPADWEYVFSSNDALQCFQEQHTRLCFFGHTHVQGAFVCDGKVTETHEQFIEIESGKKYLVNAGSVGQPRDGDWRAAYCIFHANENRIEQRRIVYDVQATRRKVLAAGLPHLLADRLVLGR